MRKEAAVKVSAGGAGDVAGGSAGCWPPLCLSAPVMPSVETGMQATERDSVMIETIGVQRAKETAKEAACVKEGRGSVLV